MSVLGWLLLAFAVGAAAGLAEYWPNLKREWRTTTQTVSRESAERILESRKRVLLSDEPPERVNAQDYAFRGFAFYNTNQAALERLGCAIVGDFSLQQADWTHRGFRSFVRVMHTADRQAVASIVDATPHLMGMSAYFKLRFYLGGRHNQFLKGISFRTELTDGRFLITSTHADFVREDLPPEILKETVARETEPSALLERHRSRVAAARSDVVLIGTVEEFGESFVRHTQTVRRFREEVGFAFTDSEQQDFTDSESPISRETAENILDAMRTLEHSEKKKAS